ncbi:MAG: hypothetical protein M3Y17_10860, partial [Actinomycetota bacterium]|nr:hypothetical protein [Actinomycetota bacterium]
MDRTCEVAQTVGLPAARLLHLARRPRQRILRKVEFDHRLGDGQELMRRGEVPAEQLDDPLAVAIEDRQRLPGVADREGVLVAVRLNGGAVRGQALLAERVAVADRIRLEEVLVDEPDPDHPVRQLHGVGHTGLARARMQLEQIAREIPDHRRGVVRTRLDHLHNVAECPLQQRDKVLRRAGFHRLLQLVHDRTRLPRPLHALAVPKELPCAQPTIDLSTQDPKVTAGAGRREPQPTLDVQVPFSCPRHQLPQLIDVETRRKIPQTIPEVSPAPESASSSTGITVAHERTPSSAPAPSLRRRSPAPRGQDRHQRSPIAAALEAMRSAWSTDPLSIGNRAPGTSARGYEG